MPIAERRRHDASPAAHRDERQAPTDEQNGPDFASRKMIGSKPPMSRKQYSIAAPAATAHISMAETTPTAADATFQSQMLQSASPLGVSLSSLKDA